MSQKVLKRVSKQILKLDRFGYNFTIHFNNKDSCVKTLPGGLTTIAIAVIILFQTYNFLLRMLHYENDRISENEVITDFEKMGLVTIERIGNNIPYYGFDLPIHDEELCNGSCLKHVE